MILLYAKKNMLSLRQKEPLTSGSVNAYRVEIGFSSDWEGLTKTAVFRSESGAVSVLLDEAGGCAIPWEVLQKPVGTLSLGVYGTREDKVVLPTAWTTIGAILEGAAPGEDAQPPTPDLWQQALAAKQDKLTGQPGQVVGFDESGSAVAQDNSGGSGGQGPPGPPGEKGEPGADGKSAYEIAVENGFSGTEQEWLDSLQGGQGPPGSGAEWSAGEGITITGGDGVQEIRVSLPTKAMSLAEYEALSPEEKSAESLYVVPDGGGESSGGDVYLTEEARIGTWIDGKPLYRKVVSGISGAATVWTPAVKIDSLDTLAYAYGTIADGNRRDLQTSMPSVWVGVGMASDDEVGIFPNQKSFAQKPFTLIVHYTKTAGAAGGEEHADLL